MSDWRSGKCGHNMNPMDCTAERCGYRSALQEIARLERELAEEKKSRAKLIEDVLVTNPSPAED